MQGTYGALSLHQTNEKNVKSPIDAYPKDPHRQLIKEGINQ